MVKKLLYIAWVQSLLAIGGSLYFSEILKFPPCILCWYQRIFIYPLVLIIPVGIMSKDKKLPLYVLPLSITGTVIAIYHNLLYWNILPETIAPCIAGASCTTKFVEFFGFVTIPLLSLCAFLIVDACMILCIHLSHKKI